MKNCNKCKESKSIDSFSKDNRAKDGLQGVCKSCYREWRNENSETIKALAKEYRKKNRESHIEYGKAWRLKNKEYVRASDKERRAIRKKKDPMFRAICNLRSRLSIFCRASSMDKRFKTLDSVGLSPEEFKSYIESLFSDGMNWDNYGIGIGKWSIDHTKPLCVATTLDELYALNHYTNLTPMWNEENFSKGGKWIENNLTNKQ